MDTFHDFSNEVGEASSGWPWYRIGLAVFGFILLCPYPTLICPAWKAQIIDQANQPIQHVMVLQRWGYFSSYESRVYSDNQGYVSFPARHAWATLLMRGLNGVWQVISLHGGSRPSAIFVATGTGKDGLPLQANEWYSEEEPLPKQLQLHPVR